MQTLGLQAVDLGPCDPGDQVIVRSPTHAEEAHVSVSNRSSKQ